MGYLFFGFEFDKFLFCFVLFCFFKGFIYLFDRERDSQREREHKQGDGGGGSRLLAEEPDMGLDPITTGSRPELKADT